MRVKSGIWLVAAWGSSNASTAAERSFRDSSGLRDGVTKKVEDLRT